MPVLVSWYISVCRTNSWFSKPRGCERLLKADSASKPFFLREECTSRNFAKKNGKSRHNSKLLKLTSKSTKTKDRGIWRLCETLGETQDYYSDTFDNLFKLSNVLLQSNVGLSEKYFPRMLLRWALRCFGRSGSRILMFTTGRSPTCTPSPLRTGGFWRRSRKWNDALFLKICSLVSKWQGSLLTEIDDKVDRWNFFLSEGKVVVVYCLRIVVLVYYLRIVVLVYWVRIVVLVYCLRIVVLVYCACTMWYC